MLRWYSEAVVIETTLDTSLELQSDTVVLSSGDSCITVDHKPNHQTVHMIELNPSVQLENGNFERRLIARVRPQVEIDIQIEEHDEEEVVDTLKEAEAITQFPSWIQPSYVNRIKKLKCFELVREMLIHGIPAIEVARKIQQMGELQHMKIDSLRLQVEHYRNTIPAWVLAARQQNKPYLEVKAKGERQIDIMDKLARLYEIIERRIDNSMAIDEKFGIITMGIERSFVLAKDLLLTIQMMREKLGIGPGQEGRSSAVAGISSDHLDWSKIYARESVAKVMNDPESRSRVVRVAERLLDLYGPKLSQEWKDNLNEARDIASTDPTETFDLEKEVTIDSL